MSRPTPTTTITTTNNIKPKPTCSITKAFSIIKTIAMNVDDLKILLMIQNINFNRQFNQSTWWFNVMHNSKNVFFFWGIHFIDPSQRDPFVCGRTESCILCWMDGWMVGWMAGWLLGWRVGSFIYFIVIICIWC